MSDEIKCHAKYNACAQVMQEVFHEQVKDMTKEQANNEVFLTVELSAMEFAAIMGLVETGIAHEMHDPDTLKMYKTVITAFGKQMLMKFPEEMNKGREQHNQKLEEEAVSTTKH